MSTSEAEYIAFTECGTEVKHLQQLFKEIYREMEPAILYGDNMGSLLMSENFMLGSRTKHIEVKYHFIKQEIQSGRMIGKYVHTSKNMADGYTKNLDIKKFEEQREWSLNTTESQVEESSNRESVEGNSKLLKCSTFPELPNDENSKITRNSPKNEFDILTEFSK